MVKKAVKTTDIVEKSVKICLKMIKKFMYKQSKNTPITKTSKFPMFSGFVKLSHEGELYYTEEGKEKESLLNRRDLKTGFMKRTLVIEPETKTQSMAFSFTNIVNYKDVEDILFRLCTFALSHATSSVKIARNLKYQRLDRDYMTKFVQYYNSLKIE